MRVPSVKRSLPLLAVTQANAHIENPQYSILELYREVCRSSKNQHLNSFVLIVNSVYSVPN